MKSLFDAFYVEDEGVRAVLAEPFRSLLPPSVIAESGAPGNVERRSLTEAVEHALRIRGTKKPALSFFRAGLKQVDLVLLSELLSNFEAPDLPLLDNVQRRPKPDEGVQNLQHPNRKLQPAEVDELVQAYRNRSPIPELARRFGMHEQTVRAHLKRAGVFKKRGPAVTPKQAAEAGRIYKDTDCSIESLATKYCVGNTTMRMALHKAGVPIRRAGRHSGGRT